MSTADDLIKKIQFFDELFSSGGRYTPEELSQKLKEKDFGNGISVKSVYRILTKMKNEMNAPIAIDDEKRRYYSGERTMMLPGYIVRAENFHFAKVVKNLLDTLEGSPVFEQAQKIFKELPAYSPYKTSGADSAPSRVIFLGAPTAEINDTTWNTIFYAMEHNFYIVIDYRRPGAKEPLLNRGIKPYQLIFDNGIWDLWGYDCLKKRCQQYNLGRIQKITLVDNETFELPEDYDFRKVTPGTFGCYRDLGKTGMTRYKIHFRKDSYAETYAKDRIWGENPLIESDEKGTIISFDNNQTDPILRWILGWGADVKPLEPISLVENWKKEIAKLYEKINEE